MNFLYALLGILIGIALILDPSKVLGTAFALITLKFILCKLMGISC